MCDNCENNLNIRLHLVGRSSAIAPLYGKTLGSQFCMLETGYIIGLLQHEASKWVGNYQMLLMIIQIIRQISI